MKENKLTYSNDYITISREELIEVMKKALSKKRFKHVLRVEETALSLAERYDVNKEQVSIAAVAHDYAKERPAEELRDLIISENLDLDMLQYGRSISHGPVGSVLMKNEYDVEDEAILEAIKYHTIGSPAMQQVAQIIYIADFIEPSRTFKEADKARELSKESLEKTIAYISRQTLKDLLKRKTKIYPRAIETYNAWAVLTEEEDND